MTGAILGLLLLRIRIDAESRRGRGSAFCCRAQRSIHDTMMAERAFALSIRGVPTPSEAVSSEAEGGIISSTSRVRSRMSPRGELQSNVNVDNPRPFAI